MIVYLLRHGIAVDIGERGVTCDEERMLSADGARKTRRALAGLATLDIVPDIIYSSALVRAAETAALAAEALGCPLAYHELLVPEADPHGTVAWLGGLPHPSLMLVGHMPHLAALAGLLVAGDASAGIDLKKAAVAKLTFTDAAVAGAGTLNWLLPPKVLVRLAERR